MSEDVNDAAEITTVALGGGDTPQISDRGHSVAASTVLAKVCTCQIDDTNRIDSAECPRHGDLVRDAAWDACMGPDDDKHRR